MPLFFQQNTNEHTRLGIWHITEEEAFFLEKVSVQRELSHPHKRLQHLAGRYLLQHLFPDFPYHEMLIADSRKPYLPNERYHFSISHCGDYAAAIVSTTKRVGIDIEIPTPRVLKIASKFLHEAERVHFNIQQQVIPDMKLMTVLWSAKEAAFKWWSFGSVDFSEHIRLAPFSFAADAGSMECTFLRGAERYALPMQYRLFPDLCLVYTI